MAIVIGNQNEEQLTLWEMLSFLLNKYLYSQSNKTESFHMEILNDLLIVMKTS